MKPELQALAGSLQALGVATSDPMSLPQDLHLADRSQLLEINEQLVQALLRAQSAADTAAGEFDAMSRSAEHDALTGLPNRTLFTDRMARALANAKRRGAFLGLMFLDLDDFKRINDTLGHAVGDEVLRLTGQCLASAVRDVDTVSRHGGDEFLVLLAEVSQPADAALIAGKLLTALAEPKQVGGHEIRLSASIGISFYPDHGNDMATLTHCADSAMYRAKRRGRGGFAFHGVTPVEDARADAAQPIGALDDVRMQELSGLLTLLQKIISLLSLVPTNELPEVHAAIERQANHLVGLVESWRATPLAARSNVDPA